ncbi:hypothetical protein B484DRAFT_327069, partial [Ochromonadaceae sp. CCMP2298]
SCLPPKMMRCWSGGMPSFSWILAFRLSMDSSGSTSTEIVFPVSVFTKTCMPPRSSSTFLYFIGGLLLSLNILNLSHLLVATAPKDSASSEATSSSVNENIPAVAF